MSKLTKTRFENAKGESFSQKANSLKMHCCGPALRKYVIKQKWLSKPMNLNKKKKEAVSAPDTEEYQPMDLEDAMIGELACAICYHVDIRNLAREFDGNFLCGELPGLAETAVHLVEQPPMHSVPVRDAGEQEPFPVFVEPYFLDLECFLQNENK